MKLGDKYHKSFVIDDNVYNGFRDTFKDENPLHTDEAFAKGKGFSEKVMYGNILNGFVSYFVGEMLPTKDVIIHSQEIKFHKPVFLNDEVHFDAELKEVYESVSAYVFKFKFSNEREGTLAKGKVQIGVIS